MIKKIQSLKAEYSIEKEDMDRLKQILQTGGIDDLVDKLDVKTLLKHILKLLLYILKKVR